MDGGDDGLAAAHGARHGREEDLKRPIRRHRRRHTPESPVTATRDLTAVIKEQRNDLVPRRGSGAGKSHVNAF